jgi:hypothetical protein
MAKEALRERLVDVKREGRRKLEPLKLEVFAREWLVTYPDAKGLKRSTRESYESIIERHLNPRTRRVQAGRDRRRTAQPLPRPQAAGGGSNREPSTGT